MRLATAAAIILVAIVPVPMSAQDARVPALNNIPIDFAKLVDSLKNNNNKPRIVGGWEVRFSDNYDFSEQRRIHKATRALQEYAEEAWPCLVQNLDNAEYSITFGFSDASRNYTVGQVCEQIVRNTLYVFHDQCADLVNETSVKMIDLKNVELRELNGLKAWLRDRGGKSLLDLQIELAVNLEERISSLELPEERKVMFTNSVQEHLRYIRRRGYAEVGNRFIPNRESWWYLVREDATK